DQYQTGNQSLRAEAFQLIAGQQSHRQAEEKRNHCHERHGPNSGALGVPKKTDGTKWGAAAAHVLERFRESVDDEPKHAAHFAEKTAAFLANPSDDDDRIGLDLAT